MTQAPARGGVLRTGAIWLFKALGGLVVVVTFFQSIILGWVEKRLDELEFPIDVAEEHRDLRHYTIEFTNRSRDRTIEDLRLSVDSDGTAISGTLELGGRVLDPLESSGDGTPSSERFSLDPGETLRCRLQPAGEDLFARAPMVTVYGRNLVVGTPAEIQKRNAGSRDRSQRLRRVVWKWSLIAAGLFCLIALALVFWHERTIRRLSGELERERSLRHAGMGLRGRSVES